jgi:hypothetical protein
VIEIRRYLGNTLSVHVHDADHETPNCRLGNIPAGNRRWYDSLEEARSDLDYEDCLWCITVRAKASRTATESVSESVSGTSRAAIEGPGRRSGHDHGTFADRGRS